MPAVSICTDAFGVTADAMAQAYGFPGYEYLVLPHPVASLTAEQLAQRVTDALPRLLEILGVQE